MRWAVFDEVYGFMPPHPANPPTKRPLVALMKQARVFGVGVMVSTQNPLAVTLKDAFLMLMCRRPASSNAPSGRVT